MLTKKVIGLALASACAVAGMSISAAKADPFHRYSYHYYNDGYGFNPVGAAIGTAAGIVGGAAAVAAGYPYGPDYGYGPYAYSPYAYNYPPHAYGYYGPDYAW